jgi:hypothetical protein
VKKNIIYFVAFVITFITNAQVVPPTPGGGGSGVATGGPPGGPGLPINDYLYLLVILGVFYGIKKIKSLSTD